MTNVQDIKAKAKQNKKKQVRVYNPTNKEVLVKWNGEPYSIGPRQSEFFSFHKAMHLANFLIKQLAMKKTKWPNNPKVRQEIKKVVLPGR